MIIRTLSIAATLLLSSLAVKGQTVPDTLVIKDARKVTIETTDTAQHIIIKGTRLDSDFKYDQRIAYDNPSVVRRIFSSLKDYKKVHKGEKPENKAGKVECGGYLNIGLTAMVGISDTKNIGALKAEDNVSCNARLWPSYDIGFGTTADWYPFGNKNCWSIGFGINWRYYRFSSSSHWTKVANSDNNNEDWMELQEFDHSRQHDLRNGLHVFSLQIPVLYTHTFDTAEEWKLMLGGFVNFNTGAHTSYGFTDGDNEVSIDTYKIGQRPVTVDLLVGIKTPILPMLYCKYSPTTFFKNGRGPKMHQLSFGFWF